MNVLLIEDEPRVADFIDRGLRAENHGVTVGPTGAQGIDLAKTGEFDVIILDLMLPDIHGYEVCQRLRQDGIHTPILMLTAMDALEDKIKGIKIGADDYLTKPFEMMELLARVEALLRRGPARDAEKPGTFRFGEVRVDFRRAEVVREGKTLDLSALEYKLLRYFIEHQGATISRDELLNEVWGYEAMPYSRTVDVHVSWLRQKLEPNPSRPRYILTVHGLGYKFINPPD